MEVKRIDFGNFSAYHIIPNLARKMGMGIFLYTDAKSMIDTASRTAREGLLSVLPSLSSLKSAYITHFHEDHTGNAALLKRTMQVEIFAPHQSLELLAKEKAFKLQPYRLLFWGRSEPFTAKPLPNVWEFGGMRMRSIPAFGHSFDQHVFFAEDTGYLFSADLIIMTRNYYMMAEEDMVSYVKSLKSIARLPITKIFCAHRGALKPDAIFQKLDFYKEVACKVKELYKTKVSIGSLTRKVAGRANLADFMTLWHYSRIHLIRKMVEVVKDDRLYSEVFDY